MKKLKNLVQKVSFSKGIAGLAIAAAVFSMASLSCFAAEGKVTAETAKIRAEANTSSEVVGSTVKGKVIELLGAVKDSSGTTWYKVSVAGGGYGYIRGDLVSTNDTVPTIENSTSQSTSQSTQSEEPAATESTAINEQQATINSETNVRIRSGASTQHSVVTSLPNGTTITLIGEATDSAGNKWYQLRCDYNGRTVEGYVRSDLITIGGSTEQTEGEAGESTEGTGEGAEGETAEGEGSTEASVTETPAAEEHNDYQIVYTQNSEGEYEYYLYDNINGTRQKLAEILAVVNTAVESNQALQEKVNQEKIIIVILAILVVVLFVAVTVLLFKLKDFYYEEYEEDEDYDEEEEEEEPAPVKKKWRKQEVEEEVEEEPVPVKKKKVVQETAESTVSQLQKVKVKEEEPELYAAEKKAPVKKTPSRKAQNFLIDDDEFEFEFLNMDDKDL